jgi:penicillin-binding protein 2
MLLHSLWQGAVVAVALAILLRLMRRATARARHAVACVALLAMAIWPALTLRELTRDARDIVEAPWQTVPIAPGSVPFSKAPVPTGSLKAESMAAAPRAQLPASKKAAAGWQGWTVMCWLAGVALFSIWHFLGWLGLRRLRQSSTQTISGELAGMAARLAGRMQISPTVRIYWSSRVSGAISFGWWRPVVLLPVAMATGCSAREVEMILAHEFAHLRRHDYLVNLLQSIVETLFFYHPAVWWVSHCIRREREHACDDAAVRATGDSSGYARALLEMATRSSTPTPRLALAARGRGELRTRIERLLRPTQSAMSSPLRPVWGMAMLVTVLLALTAPDGARTLQAEDVAALGPRGSIRDRNGVVLAASDRPDRQIVFNLEKVIAAWRAAPGREVPTRTYPRAKDGGGTEDVKEPDMVYVFEQLVIPVLESHQLARPFNANAMRVHYREHKGLTPFVYAQEVTEEEAQRVTAVKDKVAGMDTRTLFLRHYPFKAMAAHLLGYTVESEADDSEQGASGLEKSMQSTLGPPTPADSDARRGGDVYLTLDARHQYIAERALRDCQPAIGRGAVVLLDVSSGDVLAMAAAPSYDPNNFIPSISREKFEKLQSDTTNPLLNRSVRSIIPGSAFKVATSLAAICDGKEAFQAKCEGSVTYNNRLMKCWIGMNGGQHGMLDLRGALKESCNTYFYQIGNAIQIDKFEATVALLGIGQDVGIELPENEPGLFPTRAWWAAKHPKEKFSAAVVANQSIGQGALQVTPLQMASLMVPVANGGTVWHPRLVARIAPHGDASRQEKRPLQRATDLREQGLTATGLEMLRAGLRDVVKDGPGRLADLPNVTIAGKTGTAQYWRSDGGKAVTDNHTLFVAYAPVENPKWAICVFVQGGKAGGSSAAPIAAHILSQVADLEAGTKTIEPKPLEPILGTFVPVDRVTYPPISK